MDFQALNKKYVNLESEYDAKCDELEITKEQYGDMIEALQDEMEEWKQKCAELKGRLGVSASDSGEEAPSEVEYNNAPEG